MLKTRTIISIVFITIGGYLLFRTYKTIQEVNQKQQTQIELEKQVQKQRYKYLQEMLKQKEIIQNHEKYIEQEARNRLGYAMEGETVIYFPEEPITYNSKYLQIQEQDNNPKQDFLANQTTYKWLQVLFP